VQAHYVAINPVDWKIQSSGGFGVDYPAILGEDLVGEVLDVGSNLRKQYNIGSRIMAHTWGLRSGPKYGAFQLYPAVHPETACLIPDDISFEDAVVLPLSISTAAAGLYLKDNLSLPLPTLKPSLSPFDSSSKTILLWGGSSSVGSSVIQLATASGYHVITTASPRNYKYCKLLGATLVLDYHNPDIVPILVSLLRDTDLAGAYDAIGSDTTARQCAIVLHALGGGTVASVVSAPETFKDVKIKRIASGAISSVAPEIGQHVWGKFIPAALESGQFVPAPKPLLVGKGLKNIQKALDRQKEGVSAQKVVVKLS
jgi:NADPH:quinone reductase-like Zn-dependent oxidoreductase